MLELFGHMRSLMAMVYTSWHACYASGFGWCVDIRDLSVAVAAFQ